MAVTSLRAASASHNEAGLATDGRADNLPASYTVSILVVRLVFFKKIIDLRQESARQMFTRILSREELETEFCRSIGERLDSIRQHATKL